MDKKQVAQEALSRARSNQSFANFPIIIEEFAKRGISEDQIRPRENVFTFRAWNALGRHVKKGEHGVKVFSMATTIKRDEKTGEENASRRPVTATVFHISQTDINDRPY